MASITEIIIHNIISSLEGEKLSAHHTRRSKLYPDYDDASSNLCEKSTTIIDVIGSILGSIYTGLRNLFITRCTKCGSENVVVNSFNEPRSTYSAPDGLITSSNGKRSHAVYEVGITTTIVDCSDCGYHHESKSSYKKQIDSFMK